MPSGPWTNLQDLFAAHPDDLAAVTGIHAMAGTIDAPGNIELGATTPADQVEWNVGADPDAFAAVMALDVPVTLVPLDATNDAPVPVDILAILDADHAAAGADIAYETYVRNPYLAAEGNYWWDSVAAVGLADPGLLTWEDMNVTVTDGSSAAGRINRDAAGRPVRAAMGADGARVRDAVLAGLRRGAPRPEPFTPAGTLRMTWDGTTCRMDGDPPTTAGLVQISFANRGTTGAGLVAAGVRAAKDVGGCPCMGLDARPVRRERFGSPGLDRRDRGPGPLRGGRTGRGRARRAAVRPDRRDVRHRRLAGPQLHGRGLVHPRRLIVPTRRPASRSPAPARPDALRPPRTGPRRA